MMRRAGNIPLSSSSLTLSQLRARIGVDGVLRYSVLAT
jgi:hypothetical protein